MNLWNVKFDWFFNTGTTIPVWEKVNRLNDYVNNDEIDNLDEIYFKFQKCVSGLTYQYVLDLHDIYDRNVMVGDSEYTELFYNEYDVIDEYMENFNYVDFYINEEIDINQRITKIDGHYLKSAHKLLIVGQTGITENNGIYSFDADGYLQKTTDLDTTGQTYRYGVHVKMDNNNNIEYFLQNSGNTFSITGDEMDFMSGHTYILKNGFEYDINNTGTTYDSIPKLWFTDYNFARKLNKLNYSLYNTIVVPTIPTSVFSIQYRNNPPVDINLVDNFHYFNSFTYSYSSGKTILTLTGSLLGFDCKEGDYLSIDTTSSVGTTENFALFYSTVESFVGTDIILNEYIPNYVLSGATLLEINNINNIKTSSDLNLSLLNQHYYSDFFTFSGETLDIWQGTVPLEIIPKQNEFSKYIDYDAFTFTFDTSGYTFESDNHYVDYKLYEHLSGITSNVFDNTFDLGSGNTMTNFTQEATYLLDDPAYPQTISDRDSPIKITPTSASDLDDFYKFTSVYIDDDYDNKVFILDKDDTSITIERPILLPSGDTISSVTSYYSLTGISETLYDVYLNTGITYYEKDDEFRSRIYTAYNILLSSDSRIRQYTTGTITANDNNRYILKLYNYRNNSITNITGNTIDDVFYANDDNLMFKPLEILDIGINKQSKMPVLIYNDDLRISDTLTSGHTVSISKDSIISNISLVDGMTLERLKVKYIWVFNAIIEDAVIGEDEYGLVWYKGTWVCGEWADGTWYSGTWLNGIWKNGKWLSWSIDIFHLLSSWELKKLDDNKKYSTFVNGEWRTGVWYNGTFGDDISISGYTSKSFLSHTDVLPDLNVATWKNGDFYDGVFKNSIWEKGNFIAGMMYGGYWKNGTFNNGTFDGNWWDGYFSYSDFISGIWENGVFSYSRFGYNSGSTSAITSEWWNGDMNFSEVYAGIYSPINYNRTHCYGGVIRNSKWVSGHFFTGIFRDSTFYNGVFGTKDVDILDNNSGITFQDSDFMNGLWVDGTFVSGNFRNGIWLSGDFLSGNLRTINPEVEKPVLPIDENYRKLEDKRRIL